MRRLVSAIAALVFSGCAAYIPHPTPQHPISGCSITCPTSQLMFSHQHICQGGRRWFTDIRITGRETIRGDDGTVIHDRWLTQLGDEKAAYDVEDVELTSCDSYIRSLVLGRSADQRGVHPGERDYGDKP